jgi:hypothetical protein
MTLTITGWPSVVVVGFAESAVVVRATPTLSEEPAEVDPALMLSPL